MSGFGIKAQTDTGHWLWLTTTGTAKVKTAKDVLRFDSEVGAEMDRKMLAELNPHATLKVQKL